MDLYVCFFYSDCMDIPGHTHYRAEDFSLLLHS